MAQYQTFTDVLKGNVIAETDHIRRVLKDTVEPLRQLQNLAVEPAPCHSAIKASNSLVDPGLLKYYQKGAHRKWKELVFRNGLGIPEGSVIYPAEKLKNEDITKFHKDAFKAKIMLTTAEPLLVKSGARTDYVTSKGFSRYVLGLSKEQSRRKYNKRRKRGMKIPLDSIVKDGNVAVSSEAVFQNTVKETIGSPKESE